MFRLSAFSANGIPAVRDGVYVAVGIHYDAQDGLAITVIGKMGRSTPGENLPMSAKDLSDICWLSFIITKILKVSKKYGKSCHKFIEVQN